MKIKMSDKEKINIIRPDDFVNIFFQTREAIFEAKVIFRPSPEEPFWEMENKDGQPFVVKNYDLIEKISSQQT